MGNRLFTSESVTEGHPDKVCDQISDAVLDAMLAQDKRSRVAVETLVKTGLAVVAGEVTTTAWVNLPNLVRETIRGIGYTDSSMGFDGNTCAVLSAIEKQSPDIAQGVDEGSGLHKEQGAGDQGLMFGFACDETKELMPLPIMLAHKLTRRLAECRKEGVLDFLRPDGKSQVTVEYDGDKPVRVDAVVLSTQHHEDVKYKALREALIECVIEPSIPKSMMDKSTKLHVNPTGRFVYGGPYADSGVTGRKIIVDTYGGMGRHGGGAFSGKDPTKVDRSAAYYARYIAKNIVAAKLATRCEVQIAYAIGVAQPVGAYVTTFGTGVVSEDKIAAYVIKNFDMRPKAITDALNLLRPIYKATAAYGHFGRNEFSWEKTNRASELAAALLPAKSKSTNGNGNGHKSVEVKKGPAKRARRATVASA